MIKNLFKKDESYTDFTKEVLPLEPMDFVQRNYPEHVVHGGGHALPIVDLHFRYLCLCGQVLTTSLAKGIVDEAERERK